MKNNEIVTTTSEFVSCSGGNETNGHPKVYLPLNNVNNEVICPYCQKKFIKKIN